MFSKSYCPYCIKAKKILTGMVGFLTVELDQREDGNDIQSYLVEKTKQRTVPQIFIHQQFVGGCDDLTKKQASGELKSMLKL